MADFLLELLSEEIPARMQAKARNDLARIFADVISNYGLRAEKIEVFSTPRRLALIARDLPAFTQPKIEERKGPKAGAPQDAIDGFLKSVGIKREELEERVDAKGVATLFATKQIPGLPAAEIIRNALFAILTDFPWPKSMRWGSNSKTTTSMRWIRPLHGIVALLGEDIVPFEMDGIESGATTVGHRFHHPGPITIGGACDYIEKLRACHVIVDQDEREQIIRDGAEVVASEAGLTLSADEGLVVENAGLTEWPVPLLGQFDAEFLDVPREVIVLTMRTNQKYFACTNDEGLLAPAFVCVANIAAKDKGAAIVEGNRRVLAARLADARFFWEQDLKVPLEGQAKKLDGIVFHEKLGTIADKVERVAKLARWLVDSGVVKADADQVERAARLAKADLVTGMVGEFPELQGVIGGYLAEAQGESKAVADAIRDHYGTPSEPTSVAVALADKLDTLIAFFGTDELPSGSRDPFALRRAALNIIRIVVENGLRVSLDKAFRSILPQLVPHRTRLVTRPQTRADRPAFARAGIELEGEALERYLDELVDQPAVAAVIRNIAASRDLLLDFFADRLKVQQREAGVRHDLIDAVFALGGEDDLVRLLARVNALQQFVETEDGADLLTGYKRAANILKKENWTGGVMTSAEEQGIPQTGEEDPLVLVDDPIVGEAVAEMASGQAGAHLPQEKALIAALDKAEPKASKAVDAEDFTGAMAALASLRRPIDDFFDHVTVNDPDSTKRERRLNLLMRFRDAVNRVADFSRIEG